jgi:hypothetical protein
MDLIPHYTVTHAPGLSSNEIYLIEEALTSNSALYTGIPRISFFHHVLMLHSSCRT